MYRPKKPPGITIVIIFFSIVVVAAIVLLFKIAEKKRVIDGRNTFSSLEITFSGNQKYTISSAAQDDRFIIMFYDADCYYCHVETQALLENIDDFADIDIFMVTANEPDIIAEFEDQYELAGYPRIKAGRISEDILSSAFGIRAVPSILIYDENGGLIYSNSGYTPVTEILKALEK